jgi:adenylylsulfate kinase
MGRPENQQTSGSIDHQMAFALWLTGLPASGKSAITALVKPQLERLGLTVEVLESDEVRRILTPGASYSQEERDVFYRALAFTGSRLVANGVTVLFDATASRRSYREFARGLIPRFVEVAIECPLAVCIERDKKGTYDKGRRGESMTVPGLQAPYEAPLNPDLTIDTTALVPQDAADQIVALVKKKVIEASE